MELYLHSLIHLQGVYLRKDRKSVALPCYITLKNRRFYVNRLSILFSLDLGCKTFFHLVILELSIGIFVILFSL